MMFLLPGHFRRKPKPKMLTYEEVIAEVWRRVYARHPAYFWLGAEADF